MCSVFYYMQNVSSRRMPICIAHMSAPPFFWYDNSFRYIFSVTDPCSDSSVCGIGNCTRTSEKEFFCTCPASRDGSRCHVICPHGNQEDWQPMRDTGSGQVTVGQSPVLYWHFNGDMFCVKVFGVNQVPSFGFVSICNVSWICKWKCMCECVPADPSRGHHTSFIIYA